MGKTVDSDAVCKYRSRDEAVDAFVTGGYRKMMLKLLEVSAADMMSSDEVLAKSARNWFDPVMGRDAPVTFEACIVVLGGASRIDDIRQRALQNPKEFLSQVKDLLQSNTRDGNPLGPRDEKMPSFDASGAAQLHRAIFANA